MNSFSFYKTNIESYLPQLLSDGALHIPYQLLPDAFDTGDGPVFDGLF